MLRLLKKYKVVLFLICVEGFLIYRAVKMYGSIYGLDIFFFTATTVWCAILYFSLRGGSNIGRLKSFGRSKNLDAMNERPFSSRFDESPDTGTQDKFAFVTVINGAYLLMIILNLIGYIVITNIKY